MGQHFENVANLHASVRRCRRFGRRRFRGLVGVRHCDFVQAEDYTVAHVPARHTPSRAETPQNSPRRATRAPRQTTFLTATKDAVYGLDSSPRMSPILC